MNTELLNKLDQYFTVGMTPFQMRNFVVKDFMTAYRQMRQIVIEMKTRISNKYTVELDLEEIDIHIERLKELIGNLSGFDQRLQTIELRRKEFAREQKQALLIQIQFELDTFGKSLDQLIEQWGGVEQVTADLTSDEFHEQQELEFWIEKMARNAYSDMMNYGTISKGTIETIKLLPEDVQPRVMQMALEQQHDTATMLLRGKDSVLALTDK